MLGSGFRDRWVVPALVVVGVGAVFYAGSRYVRQKPTVQIQGLPSTSPSASPLPLAMPSTAPTELKVDVEGAVVKPGMQTLPPDSRVADAIASAGGKAADADTEPLNLAAKLSDGTQVFVPHKSAPLEGDKIAEAYRGGPAAVSPYSSHPSEPGSKGSRGGGKHPSGPVSLNTGSAGQLESLPGVGPSTAQKIIDYRHEHGGFSSVDEVLAVKGIGPKKLKAMRRWLKL